MFKFSFILVLLCTPAIAQENCADRAGIALNLAARFGETHQFTLVSGKYLIEVWMNDRTQTWTVIRSRPGEPSCIIAAGEGVSVGTVVPHGRDG